MKRLTWLLAIPLYIVLGLLASCQNPLVADKSKEAAASARPPVVNPALGSGVESGVVSVRLSPMAPKVAEVLGKLLPTAKKPASKAFLTSSKIHFSLLDQNLTSVVLEWDQTVDYDLFQGMGSGGTNNMSFSTSSTQAVPIGTYYLKADIFNPNDLTVPAVSGRTQYAFTVEQNLQTPVSITCFPVSPLTMYKNQATTSTTLAQPWVATGLAYNSAPIVTTVGSETWYKIYLDAGTQVQFAAIPGAGSQALLAAFLFDSSGMMRNGAGSMDPVSGTMVAGYPAAFSAQIDSSGDYYLGVMDFGYRDPGMPTATYDFSVLVTDSPPLNFRLASQSDTGITLAWDETQGAGSYDIYRWDPSSQSDYGWYANVSPGTQTSFTDTAVSYGQSYYYKALTNYTYVLGAQSPLSAPVMATAIPTAPSVQVTGVGNYNIGSTYVGIYWNQVPLAQSYTVRAYTWDGINYMLYNIYDSGGSTNTQAYSLSPQTTYYFTVQAYNGVGTAPESEYAGPYTTSAASTPDAPQGLYFTNVTGSSLVLNWAPANLATQYDLYRSTDPYSGFYYYTTVYGYGTTSYTDTGLASGVTYYYEVQAVNSGGAEWYYSPMSYWVNATTTVSLPYPAQFQIDNTDATSIAIRWNPYPNATSYDVYVADTNGRSNYLVSGLDPSITMVLDTGILPDVNYSYWVRANNSDWAPNISYERITFAPYQTTKEITNFWSPYSTTTYNVKWADAYSGNVNGTDTADVAVSLKTFDPTTGNWNLVFGVNDYTNQPMGVDSGFYNPQVVPLVSGNQYKFEVSTWYFNAYPNETSFELWYYPRD